MPATCKLHGQIEVNPPASAAHCCIVCFSYQNLLFFFFPSPSYKRIMAFLQQLRLDVKLTIGYLNSNDEDSVRIDGPACVCPIRSLCSPCICILFDIIVCSL